MQADAAQNYIKHVLLTASDYNRPKPLNTLKPCYTTEEIMTTKTTPTSEDEKNEDLDTLLAGLKQSQLDKLATELNKSKPTRNRDKEHRDFKKKLNRKNMIAMLRERIYETNRKGPHHFEDFEDFKVYDAKIRFDAHEEAMIIYKENKDD